MAIVCLEGLGQLKNPMTSLGIELMTFQLVAWCLNHGSIHKADRSQSSRQPWSICGAGTILENHDSISEEEGQGTKCLSFLDSNLFQSVDVVQSILPTDDKASTLNMEVTCSSKM
jgi:hypothetical protein